MKGRKRGITLQRRYFATIGWSSMKMVADRHRHAAGLVAWCSGNVSDPISEVTVRQARFISPV